MPLCAAMHFVQAHMARLAPPISDYVTDTRSALDNSVRLAQVRVCAVAAAAAAVAAVAQIVRQLLNSNTRMVHV